MDYRNLDVEIFAYKADEAGESFQVRVANSPAGEQKINAADPVMLPSGLRNLIRRLDKRKLDLEQMIDLGELVASLLFPQTARSFLTRSRERLEEGEGLRIRIRLDTFALADLPWEFAYIARPDTPAGQKSADGFLVLNRQISLVRYEVMGQAPGALEPIQPGDLRMVVLLANPEDPQFPELKLDVEQEIIQNALTETPMIRPEFYPHASVEALEDALTREVHIFHFSGHGKFEGDLGAAFGSLEGRGYLVLEGEERAPHLFPAEKFAQNLRGRGVRLAMLGACEASRRDQVNAWTGVAPALTRAGVSAVVGMQFTVRDDNAIAFSRRFYRALAAGLPIDAAVTDGRLAIYNRGEESERDWGVPVLYLRAESGVLFPAVPSPGMLDQPPPLDHPKTTINYLPGRKSPVSADSIPAVGELVKYESEVTDIRRQLSRNRLVLFIGADIPADISKVPSQQEVADRLADQEGIPAGQPLSAIAQQVMSHGNRWQFTDFLTRMWETGDQFPGPFYQQLARLIKAWETELIVTTAPHRMLEWALREVGELSFNNVSRDEALAFVDSNRPTLIKLFGDLDQPDTLVVTEQDLNALARGRIKAELVDEVRRAFRRNSVLFIGLDPREPGISALFDEVAGDRFQSSAYAVWTGLSEREMEAFRSNRGLTIINLDPLSILSALTEGQPD